MDIGIAFISFFIYQEMKKNFKYFKNFYKNQKGPKFLSFNSFNLDLQHHSIICFTRRGNKVIGQQALV